MRRETGQSWRFEVGDAPALTFAVRCRDELQLPVPPAVDVPPPRTITTRVPGPSALGLDQHLPVQWLTWWRRLLDRTEQCLRRPAPSDSAPAGPAPVMPLTVVRDAVEQTAQRNSVPTVALQGGVHLLPGSTVWHSVVRPGYGLMMLPGPMPGDDVLHQFICEVLESGLHGPTR